MSVGRNDPCPCGSGRKYKRCHLPLDEAARPVVREEARSLLHDLDNRFVGRVIGWSIERFGDEADPDELESAYPEIAEGGFELLLPWAVYHHTVEGLPLFEWYARENESILSRREREWIEAQRRSWMSVWEVRESVPGKAMLLTDLLTGEQRLVQEASASRSVVARDAILARVVDLGADSLLVGTHRRPLRPRDAAAVVEDLRRHFRAALPLPPERLRDEAATLAIIGTWHSVIEEIEERLAQPPQLRNTDGHPIRLITDRYLFIEAARDAVEAALTSIRGAGEVVEDDDGTRSIVFHKRGNRVHAHWDNTVVGTAFLSGDGELRLETNSVRRANALRKKVENACSGLLTGYRRSEVDPVETILAARGDDSFGDDDDSDERGSGSSAGHDALIREEKLKHYAAWPDRILPALGNKTPRQAARSRRGREDLALLLKDLENHEARQPAETRFDVNILRRELGIEEAMK
ncbi:MAG TPA: SEC-C domain-containing protein [Thermoanaerobaculia bacterium]|nr:SEC-C domain-containing protein [Thermoanaerobaculia bacterium]